MFNVVGCVSKMHSAVLILTGDLLSLPISISGSPCGKKRPTRNWGYCTWTLSAELYVSLFLCSYSSLVQITWRSIVWNPSNLSWPLLLWTNYYWSHFEQFLNTLVPRVYRDTLEEFQAFLAAYQLSKLGLCLNYHEIQPVIFLVVCRTWPFG